MIVDFYTKPFQGKQFYELRNILMGQISAMSAKECVGGSERKLMKTDQVKRKEKIKRLQRH